MDTFKPNRTLSDPVFSDNEGYQVLCKIDQAELLLCEFPGLSFPETVVTPISYLALRGFTVSTTLSVPKNPLRLVTARISEFGDLYHDGTYKLLWYLDTLECGHQVVVCYPFNPETGSRRHRCAECAAVVQAKKPAQSAKGEIPCIPISARTANAPMNAKTLTATHSKPSANAPIASATANATSAPAQKTTPSDPVQSVPSPKSESEVA